MTERAYLDLIADVMENGSDRGDRTGTGTRSVFGRQIRFDLSKGFPLLTTKKVFLRGIIAELLWFLDGDTNAKTLEDQNVNIWREWGDPETRELGPVYGKQWRNWETPKPQTIAVSNGQIDLGPFVKSTDQIADLVTRLKADPNSRRHIVVAWNPGEIDQMALPPCHCLFQFYVSPLNSREIAEAYYAYRSSLPLEERADKVDRLTSAEGRFKTLDDLAILGLPTQKLSCQLYQRSADIGLGVPFNIASYALLTMMLAQQCGFALGDFIHTFGDVHVYHNHFEQLKEQLSREPRALPKMTISKADDIFSYKIEDFVLTDYDPHPAIKMPVAV